MIEAWGRGFDKIKDGCDIYDGPLPKYDINPDGIMVLCKASDRYLRLMNGDVHVLGQGDQESDQETWDAIIAYCSSPKSA